VMPRICKIQRRFLKEPRLLEMVRTSCCYQALPLYHSTTRIGKRGGNNILVPTTPLRSAMSPRAFERRALFSAHSFSPATIPYRLRCSATPQTRSAEGLMCSKSLTDHHITLLILLRLTSFANELSKIKFDNYWATRSMLKWLPRYRQ